MGKIRVAHIITKLELGGAQQNTIFTLKTLDRDKFMPILITGNDGMLLDEALRLDGVKTYLVPKLRREISPIKDLAALYEIFKILRSTSPMIVHTHSSKAGIIG
ncbi:MAG: glycosyltransferase family 1 protein, partial [Nitrospirota bacterium]